MKSNFYACIACILLLLHSLNSFSQPFNHLPNWTTSADGILPGLLNNLALQVGSTYGYKVTGLGDINNDGYDDVAVSAPTMADVLTGSGSLAGVGAVFIYLGSSAGLSTTPSKILQPTTAVAGALFGLSVAAGDVTGDGINDIVIGAPLDKTTLGLGFLGANINASVGKIYIYRGGTANLTGTNPTPFLSLSLSVNELTSTTVSINPLFGFSVGVTNDMNNDGKKDIIVGAPTYAKETGLLSGTVKTGGAFLFLSNSSNTFTTVKTLEAPDGSILNLTSVAQGLLGPLWVAPLSTILSALLNTNIDGLLFGYSVDGTGDYNGDNTPDIVVGAPAGLDLGSLSSVLSGQILGGTAHVFTGTNNANGVNTTSIAHLQAASTGLLSNTANLFGYEVRGVKNPNGVRTGAILVGAPAGGVIANVLNSWEIKAGTTSVFTKHASASGDIIPDQTLQSPGGVTISSILSGRSLSIMFGASIDNMLDVNGDNIADIIVGEPLSTSVGLISSNLVGGGAHIYFGKANGTYNASPAWSLNSITSSSLGLNITSLVGFSVAGGGHVRGSSFTPRPVVGAPGSALNFSAGLLNLGGTVDTLLDFAAGDNGVGKAYTFNSFDNIVLASKDKPMVNLRPDIEVGSATIVINPNPVREVVKLIAKNLPSAEYTIDLVNNEGKIVATQKITVNSSSHTTTIPRESSWASGMYIIKLRSSADQFIVKAVFL